MFSITLIALLVIALQSKTNFVVQCQHVSQQAQQQQSITKLCDSNTNGALTLTGNGVCDCVLDTSSTNSKLEHYRVTCKNRQLTNIYFDAEHLSDSVKILIMSWNKFEFVPKFFGNQLQILDMSHNNITTIDDEIFEKLPILVELDLSWNHIVIISVNAFHALNTLKRLDLSHNQLKHLSTNLFSPLHTLEVLILSNNYYLNETFHQNEIDLYSTLGVTNTLARLEINDANLNRLNLELGIGLKEIYLNYNNFVIPPVSLAIGIELIDLSGNLFTELKTNFLSNQSKLRELHMRKMPTLKYIRAHAFNNLTSLRVLDLDDSKVLTHFDPMAFNGMEINTTISTRYLERINLRNTHIERLSASLEMVFSRLERLDLYGTPLICDCQLKWLKKIKLDTYGRCSQPDELKNALLTNLPKKRLVCNYWSKPFYALFHAILILSLLGICAIPIWLIVLYVRPSRRARLQKVGASSPYARITIESNRAEDNYF